MQLIEYVYVDRPNELDEHRSAHRTFFQALHDEGKVRASGPMPATDELPAGGLIVMDVATEEEAATLLKGDPFAQLNLIAKCTIRPWSPVIGDWADL